MGEFGDLPVIDCHAHFISFGPGEVDVSAGELKERGDFMAKIIEQSRLEQMYVTGEDFGLYLKLIHPRLFYAGGFAPWSGTTDSVPDIDWETH